MKVGKVDVVLASRELHLNGAPLSLGSRAFDILELLIAARGQVVSADELLRTVWPDTVVDGSNIRVHVCALRKALGEDGKLIRTVPGRGYRLGQMQEEVDKTTSAPPASRAFIAPLWHGATSPIYGREQALTEVIAALDSAPVVTLVGPGGVGKTRLAVEVAKILAQASGCTTRFISLGSISDASMVHDTVAAALGVKMLASDGVVLRAGSPLADQSMLIVLDNCEHVIEEAALLSHLLAATCPQTRILATSRAPLGIASERLYHVRSLDVPAPADPIDSILRSPAVQLVLNRVDAQRASDVHDDAGVTLIADMCRRLDGIPLALEMVAARIVLVGLQTADRELTDRLDMLTGVRRDAPLRHHTLEATLHWSYQLLNDVEKIVLRRLSAFSADFSLMSALEVVADQRFTRDQLETAICGLASKSLLSRTADVSLPRFFMLSTTRAYALRLLEEWGETETTFNRHAQVFLDLFEPHAPVSKRESAQWLQTLRLEIDNVRSALDWSCSGRGQSWVGIALAAAVVPRFHDLALIRECGERARKILQQIDKSNTIYSWHRMRLNAAYAASRTYTSGPLTETRAAWLETLAIAIRRSDRDYEARALSGLWNCAQLAGESRHALYFARRFHATAHSELGQPARLLSMRVLGIALHYSGAQQEAREHLERMLATFDYTVHHWEPIGHRCDLGTAAQATLARVLWMQGHAARALDLAHGALENAMASNEEMMTCHVLVESVIPLNLFAGNLDEAAGYIRLLNQIASRLQFTAWHACGRCCDAWLFALESDSVRSVARFRTAVHEMMALGFARHAAAFEGEAALLLMRFGQTRDAIEAIAAALARCEKFNDMWYYAGLKQIQGKILQDAGDVESAQQCFAQAVLTATRQGAGWLAKTAQSQVDALLPDDGTRAPPINKNGSTSQADAVRFAHSTRTDHACARDSRSRRPSY